MKIQNPPLVIPAKAGTQEKVGKKEPSRINAKKLTLLPRIDWFPAFAGMTTGGSASANVTSPSRYFIFSRTLSHLTTLASYGVSPCA
jgi:hypothetical protein